MENVTTIEQKIYTQIKSVSFIPEYFEEEVNKILIRLAERNRSFMLVDIKHSNVNGWECALIIYKTKDKPKFQ